MHAILQRSNRSAGKPLTLSGVLMHQSASGLPTILTQYMLTYTHNGTSPDPIASHVIVQKW